MTPKFYASQDFISEWLPKCLTGVEAIDEYLNLTMTSVNVRFDHAASKKTQELF